MTSLIHAFFFFVGIVVRGSLRRELALLRRTGEPRGGLRSWGEKQKERCKS